MAVDPTEWPLHVCENLEMTLSKAWMAAPREYAQCGVPLGLRLYLTSRAAAVPCRREGAGAPVGALSLRLHFNAAPQFTCSACVSLSEPVPLLPLGV